MQSKWRKKDRLESREIGRKGKPAKRKQGKIKTAFWSGGDAMGESWYPL